MELKTGDEVEIVKDMCTFRGNKYIGKKTVIQGIKKSVDAYILKDVEDIWYDDELRLIKEEVNKEIICGKILEHFVSVLESDQNDYDIENLSIQTERVPELNYNIIREGRKVTVIIDGEYVGVAKCHPEDSYDEYTGFEIAFKRAEISKLTKETNLFNYA